jgi:hypothetical protein
MSKNVLVSVVMPSYNVEKYVGEAVESIQSQTLDDFELIVIEDDSTDKTAKILNDYQARDPRIQVHWQCNSGVAASINRGCQLAKGKYIVLMGADDICHPQRFERQVEFLEKHPDIGICGTWMCAFEGNKKTLFRYPTDPDIAKSMLPFQLSVVGGSIMFDRAMYLRTGVRNRLDIGATDDYMFVVEYSKHCRISSIPEPLYLYRIHPEQVSRREKGSQIKFARQIKLMQLEELGLLPNEVELDLHDAISCWQLMGDKLVLKQAEEWLVKLKQANQQRSMYPEPAFSQVLGKYWFSLCLRHAKFGIWTYRQFSQSRLTELANINWRQRTRLLAKCLAGGGTLGQAEPSGSYDQEAL